MRRVARYYGSLIASIRKFHLMNFAKIFLTIIALANVLLARADEFYLGFADGNDVTSEALGVPAAQASVAIKLDKQSFWMYQGRDIIGLRVGVMQVASGVTLFITDQLGGTPLYTQTERNLYAGWNDVELKTPFQFPDEDLYIGYTVSRGAAVGCSGDFYAQHNYLLSGGDWQLAQDLRGSFCIEAIVSDEGYKHCDAALLSLNPAIAAKDESYNVTGHFRNNSNQVINQLTVQYQVAQGQTRTAQAFVKDVLPGEIGLFSFTADPQPSIGTFGLSVTIVEVQGQADTYADNSTASTELTTYAQLVPRRSVVEFFTTAKCVNCPTAHGIWERALSRHPSVIELAHHVGYYTDDYTVSQSESMIQFYADNGGSYAPAAMINRTNMADAGAINGNGLPTEGPVFYPSGDDYCDQLLRAIEPYYAPLVVDLDYTYNAESRQLTIQTSVQALAGFSQPANPRLNILLTEDGLMGYQSGANGMYEHNAVIRRFVTPTWGDEIALDEDAPVQKDYKLTLLDSWNAARMHIIGFVTNYNADDLNDNVIVNANQLDLTGETALEKITSDQQLTKLCCRYDLFGRKLSEQATTPGFVIEARR